MPEIWSCVSIVCVFRGVLVTHKIRSMDAWITQQHDSMGMQLRARLTEIFSAQTKLYGQRVVVI